MDPSSKTAYVGTINLLDDVISAFSIDHSSDALTPIDADAVTPGT